MCGYANENETKDPHRTAIQTVSSQNRKADFQNSFFPSILDPQGSIVRSPFSCCFFRFRDIYGFLPGSPRSPPPGDSNGFEPKPLGRFSKLFFSRNPRSLLHHTTVSFFSSFFSFLRYLHGFLRGCKFSIRTLRGLCPVFLKALSHSFLLLSTKDFKTSSSSNPSI